MRTCEEAGKEPGAPRQSGTRAALLRRRAGSNFVHIVISKRLEDLHRPLCIK